ncbi:hypothetical protein BACCAP_00925 [Pseudoflavonifractor capillosus ATCC 29799]|uniref:Uncharacterized protein n=1 Tax=Pseudoflavonifractor capillosus ATCC 29799 TaxID=411467 RepID=A6NRU8_9FIRM|nr:hypothetical protein BACCAP_00925 [Pseudoflavonifractor capillosus ATCC 29799]
MRNTLFRRKKTGYCQISVFCMARASLTILFHFHYKSIFYFVNRIDKIKPG